MSDFCLHLPKRLLRDLYGDWQQMLSIPAVLSIVPSQGSRMVGEEAAAITKRTWVNYGLYHDWEDDKQGQGEAFLRSR